MIPSIQYLLAGKRPATKSRRWRDGAWESLIDEMQMVQEILRHFYGRSVMKTGVFYSFNGNSLKTAR